MLTGELDNDCRVVLITEEDLVRRVVAATLEKAGFIVLVAANVEAALEFFRASGRPIRLAIVDGGAARIYEYGAVEELRQAVTGIRLLFICNSIEPEALEYLKKAWNAPILPKPFRRAKLLGTVLELMQGPPVPTA